MTMLYWWNPHETPSRRFAGAKAHVSPGKTVNVKTRDGKFLALRVPGESKSRSNPTSEEEKPMSKRRRSRKARKSSARRVRRVRRNAPRRARRAHTTSRRRRNPASKKRVQEVAAMLYPTPAAGGKRKKHLTTSQMAARKAARAYRARLSKRIGTVNRRLALSSKKVTVRTSKSGKKRKVHTASYSINRAAKHSLNAARKYVGYKYPASVRESARKLGSIRLNPSLQGVMSDIKLIAPDFALAFGGTLAVLWASMKGKAWLNDQDFIKNATADSFAMKLKPYIPALVTVVTGTAAWAGMRYLAGGKLARFSNPVLMAAAAVAAVRVAQIPLFEKTDANGAVVNGADGKPEIISLDKKLELGISSYVRVSGYTVGGYTVGGTGIFAQRTLGAGPSRLMLPAAQRVAGSGGQRHMTRRNNLDLFDNAGVLSGSIFDS